MLLNKKAFIPYYISHSMITQFEHDGQSEISLADVIKIFNAGKLNHVKQFFQTIDPKENGGQSKRDNSQSSGFGFARKPDRSDKQGVSYFSIEIKRVSLPIAGQSAPFITVVVNRISDIIRFQQQKSDEIY